MPTSSLDHRIATGKFYPVIATILRKKTDKKRNNHKGHRRMKQCIRSELYSWFMCTSLATVYYLLVVLLMQCNDVELNPGPMEIEHFLQTVTSNLELRLSQFAHNLHLQGTSLSRQMFDHFNNLGNSLRRIEGELQNMKVDIRDNRSDIGKLQQDSVIVHQRIDKLEQSLDHLDSNTREKNLKFLGIYEADPGEGFTDTDEIVATLNVHSRRQNWTNSDIDRTHRIGHGTRNKPSPRPLIVTFRNADDKLRVLRDHELRNNLRQSDIRVSADLTPRQRERLQQLRDEGKIAYYYNGKLHVEGRRYGEVIREGSHGIRDNHWNTTSNPKSVSTLHHLENPGFSDNVGDSYRDRVLQGLNAPEPGGSNPHPEHPKSTHTEGGSREFGIDFSEQTSATQEARGTGQHQHQQHQSSGLFLQSNDHSFWNQGGLSSPQYHPLPAIGDCSQWPPLLNRENSGTRGPPPASVPSSYTSDYTSHWGNRPSSRYYPCKEAADHWNPVDGPSSVHVQQIASNNSNDTAWTTPQPATVQENSGQSVLAQAVSFPVSDRQTSAPVLADSSHVPPFNTASVQLDSAQSVIASEADEAIATTSASANSMQSAVTQSTALQENTTQLDDRHAVSIPTSAMQIVTTGQIVSTPLCSSQAVTMEATPAQAVSTPAVPMQTITNETAPVPADCTQVITTAEVYSQETTTQTGSIQVVTNRMVTSQAPLLPVSTTETTKNPAATTQGFHTSMATTGTASSQTSSLEAPAECSQTGTNPVEKETHLDQADDYATDPDSSNGPKTRSKSRQTRILDQFQYVSRDRMKVTE